MGDGFGSQNVADLIQGPEDGEGRSRGVSLLGADQADGPHAHQFFAFQPGLDMAGGLQGSDEGGAFLALAGKCPLCDGKRQPVIGKKEADVQGGQVAEEKRPRNSDVLQSEYDEENAEQSEERLPQTFPVGNQPVFARFRALAPVEAEDDANNQEFKIQDIPLHAGVFLKHRILPDEKPAPKAECNNYQLPE